MSLPSVSVVMGVKNGEDRIADTIDSILTQEGVNIELIIVNDGSSDLTEKIVQVKAEEDDRIRLISRENRGLTISLIEGCRYAEGDFIARQDANDISLPERLRCQASSLADSPDATFCSTFVRHVTKEGIEALVTGDEGIIHGSVMMKRDAYHRAGGYRSQFYYAQDIDLWSRLLELGSHLVVPRIYYEGLMFPNSISGTRSKEQKEFLKIISKASQARKSKKDENKWLEKANQLSLRCRRSRVRNSGYANGAYFIGACLLEHNPSLAKRYFQDALRANNTHLRSRLKLARMK